MTAATLLSGRQLRGAYFDGSTVLGGGNAVTPGSVSGLYFTAVCWFTLEDWTQEHTLFGISVAGVSDPRECNLTYSPADSAFIFELYPLSGGVTSSSPVTVTIPDATANENGVNMIAIGVNGATVKVLFNDAEVVVPTTGASTYTFSANVSVGSLVFGRDNKWLGSIGEVYLNQGEYVDVVTNKRDIITSGGYPVDFGSDGSGLTGTSPWIYLHGRGTRFGVNSGVGSNLTVTNGALGINRTRLALP